jgi:hypothetical protein
VHACRGQAAAPEHGVDAADGVGVLPVGEVCGQQIGELLNIVLVVLQVSNLLGRGRKRAWFRGLRRRRG